MENQTYKQQEIEPLNIQLYSAEIVKRVLKLAEKHNSSPNDIVEQILEKFFHKK